MDLYRKIYFAIIRRENLPFRRLLYITRNTSESYPDVSIAPYAVLGAGIPLQRRRGRRLERESHPEVST